MSWLAPSIADPLASIAVTMACGLSLRQRARSPDSTEWADFALPWSCCASAHRSAAKVDHSPPLEFIVHAVDLQGITAALDKAVCHRDAVHQHSAQASESHFSGAQLQLRQVFFPGLPRPEACSASNLLLYSGACIPHREQEAGREVRPRGVLLQIHLWAGEWRDVLKP